MDTSYDPNASAPLPTAVQVLVAAGAVVPAELLTDKVAAVLKQPPDVETENTNKNRRSCVHCRL
jgi:hypothetical protein